MNTVTINGGFSLLFPSNRTTQQANGTPAKASSPSSSPSRKVKIRVCTSRTCRKQCSLDALQVLSGIAPPFVAVKSCGCLGRCGSGPNIVILPEGAFVGHCGTPSKAAYAISVVCGADDVAGAGEKCLEALALRKRAEDETARGDSIRAFSLLSRKETINSYPEFHPHHHRTYRSAMPLRTGNNFFFSRTQTTCKLYLQAIELKPFGGVHMMYKERSKARLAMGDIIGALEDAKDALTRAPYYPEMLQFPYSPAYICEGDVFIAMDRFNEADESYSIGLDLDPSIRRSKSFKARIAKLREKQAPANTS